MKVLSVKCNGPIPPSLKYCLNKGYRSEAIYDAFVIDVSLIPDHHFDMFRRLYWEFNHFHTTSSREAMLRHNPMVSQYKEGKFILKLRVSEAIDYIGNCTPAHLKHQIPESITTIADICQLVKDFLMDDSLGRQEYYHDAFKALTMMVFEKDAGFNTTAIDKIREHVPNGIIVHSLYSDYVPGKTDSIEGIHTFQCYNNKMLGELMGYLNYYNGGFHIIEVYKNKEGYYHIGVMLENQHVMMDQHVQWFEEIYANSYNWIKTNGGA